LAKAVYTVLGQTANLKAELVFASEEEIHNLNNTTRGVDKVTDVLSYPTLDGIRGVVLEKENCFTELDGKYIFIGSIVLCEDKIKELTAAKSRCIPFDEEHIDDKCVVCGKPAKHMVVWGRQY
jgi:ssRNA-specific RNase YbeY (16S rRNA maturation enzyme)